jgi:hypothetical protein
LIENQEPLNLGSQCRDRYGSENTPLLVDFFNPSEGEPGPWRQVLHSSAGSEEGPLRIASNFALQQSFLRTLRGLAAVSGDRRYRDAADEWAGYALPELQDPVSGLLYWGGHATYDLKENEPVVGCHEMKCVYPDYAGLYRADPERTRFFVEGFWERHVHDWSNLLFNRHGAYDGQKLRAGTDGFWDRTFEGGDLPIIENESLSFINTGGDLIMAGALFSSLSGDPAPIKWARRLLGQFDRIRHPDTGLGGCQINHREPCRVRVSFKPPLNGEKEVNETTVIGRKTILMRYGRVALTFLNLAEELREEDGREFRDFVERDLRALARHAYDRSTHTFHPLINDGRRITPDDCIEGAGYCKPGNLAPMPPNGLMFLAYAAAYRSTGETAFLEVALDQAGALGWSVQTGEDYEVEVETPGPRLPETPDTAEAREANSENDIACLMGWLELARADGRRDLVEVAARWGEVLLERYYRDGFFFDCEGGGQKTSMTGLKLADFARVGSSLPLALLHLAATIEGKTLELPLLYPNLCDFSALKNYYPETGYPGGPGWTEES